MQKELKLTGNRYNWLLTIFYISYILFEPLTLMWKVVPPHMWCAFVVFGWGLIATVQSATQSWAGEMACRFFLGIFEAGFGPGIPYLLSFFYLRHELGLRCGLFLSAAPLANCFAGMDSPFCHLEPTLLAECEVGALAYGITSGHSRLANWRLLFLVEGLPTILMTVVAFIFLPDSPDKARFLNDQEKIVTRARGVRQVGNVKRVGGIVWKDIGAALLDAKCWVTAVRLKSLSKRSYGVPWFALDFKVLAFHNANISEAYVFQYQRRLLISAR